MVHPEILKPLQFTQNLKLFEKQYFGAKFLNEIPAEIKTNNQLKYC